MFNTSLGEVFNISAEPPVLFNTSAEPSVLFNTLREAVGDPKAHETAAREADAITNSQLRPTCASRAHHQHSSCGVGLDQLGAPERAPWPHRRDLRLASRLRPGAQVTDDCATM